MKPDLSWGISNANEPACRRTSGHGAPLPMNNENITTGLGVRRFFVVLFMLPDARL